MNIIKTFTCNQKNISFRNKYIKSLEAFESLLTYKTTQPPHAHKHTRWSSTIIFTLLPRASTSEHSTWHQTHFKSRTDSSQTSSKWGHVLEAWLTRASTPAFPHALAFLFTPRPPHIFAGITTSRAGYCLALPRHAPQCNSSTPAAAFLPTVPLSTSFPTNPFCPRSLPSFLPQAFPFLSSALPSPTCAISWVVFFLDIFLTISFSLLFSSPLFFHSLFFLRLVYENFLRVSLLIFNVYFYSTLSADVYYK